MLSNTWESEEVPMCYSISRKEKGHYIQNQIDTNIGLTVFFRRTDRELQSRRRTVQHWNQVFHYTR